MAPDPLLDDVAGAVLDGDPVNWTDVEAGADATATSVVKHLRVLSIVAGVHRRKSADAPRDRVRHLPLESWGHLRLVERIGRGAFGEVYRAWDSRLDREVALKLLPAPATSSASSIIEEGRLLARVKHPGVVTIHGAEQIADRVGLWMEYIHGDTLEELLEDGEHFRPGDVIQIGLELSRAVAAVHAAGLIHRDIKAQNVIRGDDGRVMLMDFGTGLEMAAPASAPAGTPLYLAPELFAGQPATERTDVYSLGVLLYHLLTGSYPVAGRSLHDVRLAHERGERTALADARPDLPRRVIRAIEQAIDPQPARRCESATALSAALHSAQHGSRRRWMGGVAAAAALLFLWMGQTGRSDSAASPSLADIARGPAASWWARLWPGERIAIAVLPFENLGTVAGGDLMARGLASQVISTLARVEGLEVRSALSSFALRDKPRDLAAIHRDLRIDFVVEGEWFASDDRVRVIVKLVSLPDDVTTWSHDFEPRGTQRLDIQSELSLAIVNHLRLQLGGGQQRHVIDPSLETTYLRARGLAATHGPDSTIEAVRLFEEIVDAAPSYAPAWAGLASAYGSIVRLRPDSAPTLDRMREAALKALDLDPLLADAHAAWGVVQAHDLDWNQARSSFGQALSLNRSLTTIHSDAVLHLLLPLNQLDEAIELLDLARRVDPESPEVVRSLAVVQVDAGQYEDAIRNAQWVLDRYPTYPYTAVRIGRAHALSGRLDEALRVFEEDRSGLGYLGYVHARAGRRDEADALAAKAVSPMMQFLIYGGLGDKERAFEALDRVHAENPWRAATWMMRPEVAVLRDDPRFAAMRRRLRIPNN